MIRIGRIISKQLLRREPIPKTAVNWLMGEFASQLSTDGIEIAAAPVTAEKFGRIAKVD